MKLFKKIFIVIFLSTICVGNFYKYNLLRSHSLPDLDRNSILLIDVITYVSVLILL